MAGISEDVKHHGVTNPQGGRKVTIHAESNKPGGTKSLKLPVFGECNARSEVIRAACPAIFVLLRC